MSEGKGMEPKSFPLWSPTKVPWWMRVRLMFHKTHRSGSVRYKVHRGMVYIVGEDSIRQMAGRK